MVNGPHLYSAFLVLSTAQRALQHKHPPIHTRIHTLVAEAAIKRLVKSDNNTHNLMK